MTPVLLTGAVTAVLVTVFAAAVLIPVLKRGGLVDIPTARSSHATPVARGGGFAVGCGVTAGSLTAGIVGASSGAFTALSAMLIILTFVAFTWCFSILGFMDDMGSMSSGRRLILQTLIAGTFVLLLALFHNGGVFGLVAIAVAVIFIVNGVNFMDGLNALTGSWATIVGIWYGFIFYSVGELVAATLAAVFAAASFGFLPYNIGNARAFLGDVGSYGVGSAVAAFAAFLLVLGVNPVVVGAPLILLSFDVGWTLLKRLYQRENVFQAHRRHIYQLTHQAGLTHEQTSVAYAGLNAIGCLATVPILLTDAPSVQWSSVLILLFLVGIYSQLPVLARAVAQTKAGLGAG